ncbi:MAG: VWA domain-containing protein [Sedimentisphaerales bacterium]|nr:VWA domain-containing protein [Sedimentisphaerales bacterium]
MSTNISRPCRLIVLLLWLPAGMALGQTDVVSPDNVLVPQSRFYGFSRRGEPTIRINGVKAHIQMSEDTTATTTLIVELENMSATEQSAELLIPVPTDVALLDMQYGLENLPLAGHVRTKTEATAMLAQMVVDVNDPALMEFVDAGLIHSDSFGIAGAGTTTVSLSYEQTLQIRGNRVDYLLPRSEWILYTVPWDITVTIQASGPLSTVYSPSHRIDVQRDDRNGAVVTAVTDSSTMAGPFQLFYLLEDVQGFTCSVLNYPSTEFDGGYFLFLAGLPTNVAGDGDDIKRELTLVLDRSGSMRGIKIEQVKQAARQVIDGLADGEAFNLITYNAQIDTFNEEPLLKNESTQQAAFSYLETISASGLTNLHGALETALLQEPTEGFLPLILFLTDGLPTTGETREVQIRDLVLSSNPYNRRVFTLGVGYDLNAPLLDGLAEHSLGRSIFVSPEDGVDVAITDVFATFSRPLFTDLGICSVSTEGIPGTRRTYNVLPFAIPDLFQGDQLVLIGQYVGQEPFLFEINGNYRNQLRPFFCPIEPPDGSGKRGFVPRLWSSRVVAQIINEIRQLGADPEITIYSERFWDLSVAMVDLSLTYGILTEYTAFFGDGSVDLLKYGDLLHFGWLDLYDRAIKARTGKAAVNQSLNLGILKSQKVLNRDNLYLDHNMDEVRTTTIQHINDAALYYDYWTGIWIDSPLLLPAEEPNAPLETVTVEFGTPEFTELASRLALQGRQGCLAMPQDVALWEGGNVVRVSLPYPVTIPAWTESTTPGQTTTPKRR